MIIVREVVSGFGRDEFFTQAGMVWSVRSFGAVWLRKGVWLNKPKRLEFLDVNMDIYGYL